jgi:hypothetical protein
MVTVKKSVVEVALEMVQEDIRHQSLPLLQHMQGSSDAISNKKGMDSAKLPKDQVFLKVWRPYHATLESWIGKKSTHQLIHVKAHRYR